MKMLLALALTFCLSGCVDQSDKVFMQLDDGGTVTLHPDKHPLRTVCSYPEQDAVYNVRLGAGGIRGCWTPDPTTETVKVSFKSINKTMYIHKSRFKLLTIEEMGNVRSNSD